MADSAKLTYGDKSIDLPVFEGTEGEKAIDISSLRKETGLITIDPGYKNTGSTTSAITFLDGEEGILRYRGYAIEDLANNASFAEVLYLMLNEDLPDQQQLADFGKLINNHTIVHEGTKIMLESYPQTAHPMGMLASTVCAMSSYYPESLDPNRPWQDKEKTIIRLLAKLPTLIAMTYKRKQGHPYIYPNNKFDYTENFAYQMFSLPTYDYEPDPVIIDALNKLLILHADHEQNCSATTVRVVGSSNANLYASIAAGITALWGPLHGGANQSVIEMLEQIKANGGDVAKFIDKAKDKNDPFRLMGFGHRVYKNFDPRAKIIKKACDSVLEKLGIQDETLEIAKKLEEVALSDEYFVQRKLYPNVDFYSGIIYRAIGIPTEMFTVMFALGRLPGWIAQWKENHALGYPISRPRQIYTGPKKRAFKAIEQR
ncbi:MAG: citrate synthase [Bacteroidota bacterium]